MSTLTQAPALRRTRGGLLPRTLIVGGSIVLVWVALALLGPWLSRYDPIAVDMAHALAPPSATHWLGTDSFGRDMLTRLLHGARVDLRMAFFGVVGPFMIGTIVGLLAGNFGGIADTVLMRILDVTV